MVVGFKDKSVKPVSRDLFNYLHYIIILQESIERLHFVWKRNRFYCQTFIFILFCNVFTLVGSESE